MATVARFPRSGSALDRRPVPDVPPGDLPVRALWSSKPLPDPTPADALAITQSLRVKGDLKARRAGGTDRAGVWRHFDVFHDREERVAQAAHQHSALLQ